MTGFVAIHRSIWENDAFASEPMSEREAWMWMIAKAAWKDTRHRIGSKVVDVPRGAFFCTLRELQDVFCWKSDKRVRGFLSFLEGERMIGRTVEGPANARKTCVIICNYEKYQEVGRTEDAPRTHRGRTEDAVKEQGNNKTSVSNETQKAWVKPDWVEEDQVWKDFLSNRKRKRQPNTPTAWKAFNDDISRLSSPEWSPWALLKHATAKGWGAIYKPDNQREASNDKPIDKRDGAAKALDRRLGLDEPSGAPERQSDQRARGDGRTALALIASGGNGFSS